MHEAPRRIAETPAGGVAARGALALGVCLALAGPASAQAFTSGSDGSDGALTFPAGAGTLVFDPLAFTPPLDPDGDGVFHFTTITIPAGTTVHLRADKLGEGRPVVWLASGDVSIAGILSLDGEAGHGASGSVPALPSIAGAGGWSGGRGRRGTSPPTGGNGPGGGLAGTGGAQGGNGDRDYGNTFLLPLLGGSGGGGSDLDSGGGGGAGGGAILIASTTRVQLAGQILARGGSFQGAFPFAFNGGAGSSGAVRLVAPRVEGPGAVNVTAGSGGPASAQGRVRIESFERSTLTTVVPNTTTTSYGSPSALALPANAPRVRVLRVGGVDLPAQPTGSFVVPDAVIDAPGPVTVELAGSGIPLGTTLAVTFRPEDGTPVNGTSTPLTGTVEASTATIQVTFPPGYTRVFVRATWTP